MNWTAIIVFVLLFGAVTVLGFVAAHWRRGDLDLLNEWGLAGRRLGGWTRGNGAEVGYDGLELKR